MLQNNQKSIVNILKKSIRDLKTHGKLQRKRNRCNIGCSVTKPHEKFACSRLEGVLVNAKRKRERERMMKCAPRWRQRQQNGSQPKNRTESTGQRERDRGRNNHP